MKLSMEEIGYINLVESMTGAHVKDCIINGNEIVIVVKEGDMGLVIGKKGESINRVKKKIGKKISVVEYSKDPEKFVRNLFYPAKIEGVTIEGNRALVKSSESKRLIGRNGKRIKRAKELMSRHHGIENIIVEQV